MTDTIPPNSELILYQTEDGRTRIECRFEGETIWLTQAMMAELFQRDKSVISRHIKNIFEEGELDRNSVVAESATTAADGKTYKVEYYNLEVILAVGYRVRSHRGTQFRQWATDRLSEYLTKGFTMDDERLKRTDTVTDYFDELLERIREIRASEARAYQRIREIFALASDYRESDLAAQLFFAKMQNKMHFAATGLTAAEIVRQRADAMKPNMGATSWSGGRVLKRDVGTAKNYLSAEEIDVLNRIVVMFLDRAEFRAKRRQDIHMSDWELNLDQFLANEELPVLKSAGSVSHEEAIRWADEQYKAFVERRRVEAENSAGAKYLEDLTTAVRLIEGHVPKPSAPKKLGRRGKKS